MSHSLFRFPDGWDDEDYVGVMFAELIREHENPDLYKRKLSFWKQAFQLYVEQKRTLAFQPAQLKSQFIWKNGLLPECIDEVLLELCRKEELCNIQLYEKRLSKPSSWSFSGIISKAATLVWRAPELAKLPAGPFFFRAQVEDLARRCLERLIDQTRCNADRVMLPPQIKSLLMEENLVSEQDIPLVLKVLELQGHAVPVPIEGHASSAYKFDMNKVGGVSEYDKTVASLKCGIEKINRSRDDLSLSIHKRRKEAISLSSRKQKQQALTVLKTARVLDEELGKRTAQVGNLETLLLKLEQAEFTKTTMVALTHARDTIKQVNKEVVSVEEAESVMEDLQDALAEQKEVDETVSRTLVFDEAEDKELEQQLDQLLEDEDNLHAMPIVSAPAAPVGVPSEMLLEEAPAPPQTLPPLDLQPHQNTDHNVMMSS